MNLIVLLQTVAVFVCTGIIYVTALPLLCMYYDRVSMHVWVVAASICWAQYFSGLFPHNFSLHPDSVCIAITKRMPYFLQSSFISKTEAHGKTMLCLHPHGILCIGVHNLMSIWPHVYMLVSSILMEFPIWGAIIQSTIYQRMRSVNKRSIRDLMSRGKTIALVPDGFEGVALYEYGKECVDVKNKYGFIYYALLYGYAVRPVYTFGEVYTYRSLNILSGLKRWISKFKIPLILVAGRYGVLPLPSAKIYTVVGDAIDCAAFRKTDVTNFGLTEDGTVHRDTVIRCHAYYIESLKTLFETHKKAAGYPDAELEIM